jgi:TonB family protein
MYKRVFQIAIITSVLIHLSLGSSVLFIDGSSSSKNQRQIEVTFIDPSQLSPAKLEKRQIVEQSDKAINDEIPEDDYFLSKNNQRVHKQTKARRTDKFTNNAGQMAQKKSHKKTAMAKPMSRQKAAMKRLDSLLPKFDWNKVGTESSGQAERDVASGRPGLPSASNDYLKDVETGSQTLLNTREFVYYTYYSRIRRQLEQYWTPNVRRSFMKIYKSGRKIASKRDRITQVLITLNQEGTLVNVQVLGESGIQDLDQAAIDAFRAAAPFPNPPKGIVDPDGTIKIRWDFVIEARSSIPVRFEMARR